MLMGSVPVFNGVYVLAVGTGEDPPGKAGAGHEVQSVMCVFIVPPQRELTLFLL